jgi:mono/diheme cytochrome c family protein
VRSLQRMALCLWTAATLLLGACSLAEDVTPPPGSGFLPPNIATALPGTGSSPLGIPTATPQAVPARRPDVQTGAAVYVEKCAACHGPAGLGDGPQASVLPNPPSAIGDPSLGREAVPAGWFDMVTSGNIDRYMPGFRSLSNEERWDVVAYSLGLSVDPAALNAAGETFAATCAGCHGGLGEGTEAVPSLVDSSQMATRSLRDLFTVITTGSGRGMPGYGGSMTEDERWALAAYVRELAFSSPEVMAVASSATPIAPVSLEETPRASETGTAPTSAGELPAEASPTAQAVEGAVEGRIMQATAGGERPTGLDVVLHGFDGQAEAVNLTTRPGADGRFAFEGLDIVPGRLFVVTAEVGGVVYGTDVAHLPENGQLTDLLLVVHESTTDRSQLTVERVHVLLDPSTEGIVEVVELWLISNPGERTVVSEAEGGVIEVVLPEGALGLAFEEGSAPNRFVPTGQGFVDTAPVRPGVMSAQLVFSYALPYQGSLDFSQPVLHPVEAVVVLIPEGGLRLTGEGVEDQGVREASGSNAHSYTLGPLEAGETLAFRLSGRLRQASTSGNVLSSVAIGAAVLGVSLIAAGLWWYRRPSAVRSTPDGASSDVEGREALLRELAELDDAHEAGRIDAPTYARRREQLKRRLMARMREGDD